MFLTRLTRQAAKLAPKDRKQAITQMKRTTGYSLGQCKTALDTNDYDIQAAENWLNKKAKKEGWAKMEALSARRAKEGYCCIAESKDHISIFELNCETDFVAKTPAFRKLVCEIGSNILEDGDNDVERNTASIANSIYVLRENVLLNRVKVLSKENPDQAFGKYVHNPECFSRSIKGGRFAAVVVGQKSQTHPHILHGVAQQVMAHNPIKIGKWNPDQFNKLRTDDELDNIEGLEESAKRLGLEFKDHVALRRHFKKIQADEERLLYQEHMVKGRFCVGKYLEDAGANVKNMYRYQLGEDF